MASWPLMAERCQLRLAQNAIHHATTVAIRKRPGIDRGSQLRGAWNAKRFTAAEAGLKSLVASYRDSAPLLAAWLETAVPEALAVFTRPEHHRKRTANPIERAVQQEVKRRTVKVRVFPNNQSLHHLATAVLVEIDEAADPPADIPGFKPGQPGGSELLLRLPVARRTHLAVDFAGSQGSAGVAATAETDFDSQRNGTSFATMRFAAGADTASFIAASETGLEPGDVLSVVAPAMPNVTPANAGFTLAATLTLLLR